MNEPQKKEKVLFICTHNSARSQMAEGLMNARYADRFEAWSAGTDPSRVNPFAIEALAEVGIDISGRRSKSVDEFIGQELDYVVTVCDHANEACPFFPGGKKRIHHGFRNPSAAKGTMEERMAVFRRVRDEISAWIEETFGGDGVD